MTRLHLVVILAPLEVNLVPLAVTLALREEILLLASPHLANLRLPNPATGAKYLCLVTQKNGLHATIKSLFLVIACVTRYDQESFGALTYYYLRIRFKSLNFDHAVYFTAGTRQEIGHII